MRETVNTKDVVAGLRVQRHQIETWVSRDYLRPTNEAKGRAGREWTYNDAFGIAVLDTASRMGLSLQVFREVAMFGAPKLPEVQTYLVVTHGERVKLIPDTAGLSAEEAAKKQAEAKVTRFPFEMARWDYASERTLPEKIMGGACQGAIVIPLDDITAKLDGLFSDAEV